MFDEENKEEHEEKQDVSFSGGEGGDGHEGHEHDIRQAEPEGEKKKKMFNASKPALIVAGFVVLLALVAAAASWPGIRGQLRTATPGESPSGSPSGSPEACGLKAGDRYSFKTTIVGIEVQGEEGESASSVYREARRRALSAMEQTYAGGTSEGGGDITKEIAHGVCQRMAEDDGLECDDGCQKVEVDEAKGQRNPSSFAEDPVPLEAKGNGYGKDDCKKDEKNDKRWICKAGWRLECRRRLNCEKIDGPPSDQCTNPGDRIFIVAEASSANFSPVPKDKESIAREAAENSAWRNLMQKVAGDVGDKKMPVTKEEAAEVCQVYVNKLMSEGSKDNLVACAEGCEVTKFEVQEIFNSEFSSVASCTSVRNSPIPSGSIVPTPTTYVKCSATARLWCGRFMECSGVRESQLPLLEGISTYKGSTSGPSGKRYARVRGNVGDPRIECLVVRPDSGRGSVCSARLSAGTAVELTGSVLLEGANGSAPEGSKGKWRTGKGCPIEDGMEDNSTIKFNLPADGARCVWNVQPPSPTSSSSPASSPSPS